MVDGQMVGKERFEKLKAKMIKHFDNEMKLIKEFLELRPRLSMEQLQELILAMATHPHTLQSEKFIDKNELSNIFDTFKKIRKGKEIKT